MDKELKRILQLLSSKEYCTATELAETLNISSKTVRNRINEMKPLCDEYGVSIESKPRFGYKISEERVGGIQKLIDTISDYKGELPDSGEERTNYLLAYLLNHDTYTKIDDLSDFLCVSRSTLQISIKAVEDTLNAYNLQIDRRPNYGICVKGNEYDIRRCVGECFVKRNFLNNNMKLYLTEEIDYLAKLLMELTEQYKLHLSENAYENMVIQVYVAMKRIKRGIQIGALDLPNEEKYKTEYEVAGKLAAELEQWQKIEYSEEEIRYLTIYIAGIRRFGNGESNVANFVIREELDRLVYKVLERIYDEYGIEFRNNFSLRINLNQHMVSFDIRIRYNIKINNSLTEEIKQKYSFGYSLAEFGCKVLEEYYGKAISEDEIAYFAMFFIVAMEQNGQEIEKSKILIVCSAGRGSSQLLRYKYSQEFKEYLSDIYLCELRDLKTFDFSKINYVFTTVPIRQRIPVPIIEVGQFLDMEDVVKVRRVLKKGQMDFLDDYFKREQMLVDVEGNTKEEVIKNICNVIKGQRNIPDDFFEAVIKREELAQTGFGNRIAMPHPYKMITKETFVYVAVLKEEVLWSKLPVQLVLLVAVGENTDKNLPRFYESITSLVSQKEVVDEIIEEKSFDILMQSLRKIYYQI